MIVGSTADSSEELLLPHEKDLGVTLDKLAVHEMYASERREGSTFCARRAGPSQSRSKSGPASNVMSSTLDELTCKPLT
jgi:hypothetical protein